MTYRDLFKLMENIDNTILVKKVDLSVPNELDLTIATTIVNTVSDIFSVYRSGSISSIILISFGCNTVIQTDYLLVLKVLQQ